MMNKSFDYGDFVIIIIILLGTFLYLYSGVLFGFMKKENYPLVEENVKMDEDYQENVNMASIIGGKKVAFNDEGEGHGLSIYWEMYLENSQGNKGWNSRYDKLKPILKIGDTPHIYIDHKRSMLVVSLQYKDNPYHSHYPNIEVPISHQKWNSFLVVIDNRNVNIYLNNDLVKSVNLGNIPRLHTTADSIVQVGELNNNIKGEIRNLKLYYRAIQKEDL